MKVKTPILLATLSTLAHQPGRATASAPDTGAVPVASAPSGSHPSPGTDKAIVDPAKPRSWNLDKVVNLSRVPGLKTQHRDLLARQGFFLSPQPQPSPKKGGDGPLTATHLFHVYERNDYQRFPSFVTVDLAIDTTHAYFEAVLRDLEEHQLAPVLEAGISALVAQSDELRANAKSREGQDAAARVETFWAVALHLLDPVAFIPKAVQARTAGATSAVEGARGDLPGGVLKTEMDLAQMRPRGHYMRNPALQRYFRTMSWLGQAAFPIEGRHEDAAAIALLARSYLGAEGAGRRSLGTVLEVTAFFAGGADAAGLDQAAAVLSRAIPGAGELGADSLTAPNVLARLRRGLGSSIPKQKVNTSAREIRVSGRRAFEDAVAMQALIPALDATAMAVNAPDLIARLMGGRAAAAVVGSEEAAVLLAHDLTPEIQRALAPKIELARSKLAAPGERWSKDAYHGTLDALRTLFDPPAEEAAPLLNTAAWRLRAIQAFAAGWAELRHDTILYGEQLGAECDAEAMEPPASWVEPVPRLYRGLAAMVRSLEKRLTVAGVDLQFKLEPRAKEDPDSPPDPAYYYKPPAEKTKLVVDFLDFLAETADLELQGLALDRKRFDRLTMIGGEVEWILMTMANSDVLDERDSDMAVVADVFTWRPSAQVLEVAVGRPDLVFAIIPSPQGPLLARGAVMSYREFLQPSADRLTDEAWRSRLRGGSAAARPRWLDSLYTDAVGPVRPPRTFQSRCGPMSGSLIQCL